MKNYTKVKSKLIPQLIIIITRYLLGGAFVFASIIKIKGLRFTNIDGTNYPINSPFHYFETVYQSGLYWKFLGLGQLIAGGLLLTQRYTKLGAIMYFPIIVNVYVITLSYSFSGTPYITGMMVLANMLLIIWEWDTLKVLINQQPKFLPNNRLENKSIWQVTGVLLFLFTVTYRILVDKYNLFLWGGVCLIIMLTSFVIVLAKSKND